MYRNLLLASATLGLILAGPAVGQEATTPPAEAQAPGSAQPDAATASTPQEFATMAAQSDLFEVGSSRIAVEKAQNEAIREFAQQMVDDHTAYSERLAEVARSEGVNDLPQTPDTQHQDMITQLEQAPAEEFDALYVQMQVTAHEQAVALFTSYSEQQGELADFAEETLPTLQQHLEHARQLPQ